MRRFFREGRQLGWRTDAEAVCKSVEVRYMASEDTLGFETKRERQIDDLQLKQLVNARK